MAAMPFAQAMLSRFGPQALQLLQRGGTLARNAFQGAKPALQHPSALPMLGVGASAMKMPGYTGEGLGPQIPQAAPGNPGMSFGPYAMGNTGAGPNGAPRNGGDQQLPNPLMAAASPFMGGGGQAQMQAPAAPASPWAGMRSGSDPWQGMRGTPQAKTDGNRDFMEMMLMNFAKHGARTGLQ